MDTNGNTNDDEVIVQMTYDAESDRGAPRRGSYIGAHIPSTISELCGNGARNRPKIQYGNTHSGGNNHSTIHLDGEKSANENSLHYVSFFSVAEEMLMKKHLLMNNSC